MLLPYQLVQQLGVPSPANRPSHALSDPSLNPSALAVLTCEQFQYWPWSPHQRLATSPQPPRPHDQHSFKKGRVVICPCRSSLRSSRSGHKPVAQLETHPTTSSKHLQESWSSCSPLEVSNRSSYPSGPSFEDKHSDSATALALLNHSQPTLGQHPPNKHYVSSIVALCTYLGQPITKGFNTYRSIPSNTRCSHFAYSKLLIGPPEYPSSHNSVIRSNAHCRCRKNSGIYSNTARRRKLRTSCNSRGAFHTPRCRCTSFAQYSDRLHPASCIL